MKKIAFTLAEVLITLGIIGVVAAITLPMLIANIQDRVQTARVQNIKQKFSKATDKMLSVSGLNGYDSTEAFVTELQNHLKLAKICDNSHLQECWPTEKVIIDDNGKEWDISNTKTAKQLIMTNDDSHDWDDTMGIITADGTAMILSYNKKCDIDTSKPVVWTADNSGSTACIAAVFDWNGEKKPNKLSKDVIAFNAGGLGSGCAFELGGKCFMAPKLANTYLTKAECAARKGELGLTYCNNGNDYYAGAAAECGGTSKIASKADVALIASEIYGKAGVYNITPNSSIATSMGFPDPKTSPFWVWYGQENSNSDFAYRWHFDPRGSGSNNSYRGDSSGLVVCLGD